MVESFQYERSITSVQRRVYRVDQSHRHFTGGTSSLLPYYQSIRPLDQDSRTVIGRTPRVTSPIWSRTDWLAGPKIRMVGLSFAELKMDLSSLTTLFTVV